MISADQIRELVLLYLSDNDSEKFASGFAALSYNIHKNGEPDAIALARAIEFKIADLRAGCIQKPAFVIALRKMATENLLVSNTRALSALAEPINVPAVVSAYPEWAESFGTLPAVEYVSERPVPA